jgi:hypothetical protein
MMRNMLVLTLLLLAIPTFVSGQEPTEEDAKAMAADLAKAAQNPVADMNSIPVQANWTTGGGLGDETQSIINIQPVLPLPINDDWNLISRTVIPVVNLPGPDGERLKGIADIQQQFYFTPARSSSLVWGVGPIFSFPTSTNPATETGQFALGPTFVVLKLGKKWVYGGLVNNLWRIAGGEDTEAINALFLQPFINYNLARGWAISTGPAITANWNAESGQQWTVPIGLGVSKVIVVGKQPMNVVLQYYHNVERPDNAGANTIRMQFTLLFPRR